MTVDQIAFQEFNGWTGSVHTKGRNYRAWDIQGEFQSCVFILCVSDVGHIYAKATANGVSFDTYANTGAFGRCPCG